MHYVEVDGVKVFEPTFEEFQDFGQCVRQIEKQGATTTGVAKVIPPKGWKARRDYTAVEEDEFIIPAPISQLFQGRQGLYEQYNILQKPTTVKEFKILANSERYRPPKGNFDLIERKYWKNITFKNPMYGADVSGTVFDSDVQAWNISRLPSILNDIEEEYDIKIPGVNTPYLYFGMWKSTFAWHTEDMDLFSINYIHYGAPKTWYVIPPEHGKRLERLASGFFPSGFSECSNYLRHKMTVISPQVLKRYSIPFTKVNHEAGQFIITFPYAYHSGFNHGYNCAESTNFAFESWIDYGKMAKLCECQDDSVKIDMSIFVKKYQPQQWKKYKASQDYDSTSSEDEEPSSNVRLRKVSKKLSKRMSKSPKRVSSRCKKR